MTGGRCGTAAPPKGLNATTVSGWADRLGCDDRESTGTYRKGIAVCEVQTESHDGAEMASCTVAGGGHCWYSRGRCLLGLPSRDMDVYNAVRDAFPEHPTHSSSPSCSSLAH
jgi:poly(3-hydroxybutyrate) depolymerase